MYCKRHYKIKKKVKKKRIQTANETEIFWIGEMML